MFQDYVTAMQNCGTLGNYFLPYAVERADFDSTFNAMDGACVKVENLNFNFTS